MGYTGEPSFFMNEFQFESEMGPVADMSTFPPTMAPYPSEDSMGALTMENILSSNFWDSVLVPGRHSSTPGLYASETLILHKKDITVWMV